MAQTSPEARFFAKVEQDGDCWRWVGAKGGHGYGNFGAPGGRTARAHIWCYEFLRAGIPEGLQLDHLCRNRLCVNPWHLEPVTAAVNLSRSLPYRRSTRRDKCQRGHPLAGANLYTRPSNGDRACKTCVRAAQTRYAERQSARKRLNHVNQ